jgi:hypothetical protein
MVYFSDVGGYDLVPEYRFDEAIPGPPRTELAGAVVQDLRVERGREEGEGGGVRILVLSSSGVAKWWTVRRNEGSEIGVDEIVV